MHRLAFTCIQRRPPSTHATCRLTSSLTTIALYDVLAMNFPDRSIQNPIRSFVSEKDLDERRRKRQEEWEKTRKPDDPLGMFCFCFDVFVDYRPIAEAPEEEYDHRTLFERLQEQKMKKQEEYEEAHKLKNMIKGLDNDEISFLQDIDKSKIAEEERKLQEESSAIDEYKKAVEHLSAEDQEKKMQEFKKSLWSTSKAAEDKKPSTNKKSQAALLAKAIKRKSDSDKSDATSSKQAAVANGDNVARCIGVLPGLGCYESDSDEDSNSSASNEDELVGFTLLPRIQRAASCDSEAQKK